MKVLLSAVGCSLYLDLGNFIGSATVAALTHNQDVRGTGERNRADLERVANEGLMSKNVHFVFANRFDYTGQMSQWHAAEKTRAKFRHRSVYRNFTVAALSAAQKLHSEINQVSQIL